MSKGLSQKKLAERIGVAEATIGHLEHRRQQPTFEMFCQLAKTLDVSLDTLAGLDGEAKGGLPEIPVWVADLLLDLAALDRPGQEAVKVLVKGLAKKP